MGVIEYYDALYRTVRPARLRDKTNPIEQGMQGYPIICDAKPVTLAQYDRVSKNAITAHNLAEYRCKSFNMMLLPDIKTWFDILLEGSEHYATLLSAKSPYS